MTEPVFWLGLSILLVAVSLTVVLTVAIPAFQELARAARSAEKLFDTLRRELPPTLEAIRLTGLEISDLTDDLSEGVQRAGNVARQVDQSVTGTKQQVQAASITTRSVFTGVKRALSTLTQTPERSRKSSSSRGYQSGDLSPSGFPVVPQPSRDKVARHQPAPELDRLEQAKPGKNTLDSTSVPSRKTRDNPTANAD